MITVTYYPIDSDATTSNHDNLAEWFVAQFGEEMDVPKGTRITHGSANRENDITEQIALGDPDGHLTRNEGEYHVLVVPGTVETWIPLIISLVVSVAAVLLTPKPTVPSAANSRQDSATNSLGNRSNEAKPGDRFQDVRGFEPAVYADLLMEPHRRYEDNREIEHVYGTATAGFGLLSEPRDGITKWEVVEGAKLDVYGPGTEPGNGTPSQTFGSSTIDFPIVATTRSRNVTGQILAPPNQLETEPLQYRAASDGTVSTIDAPDDFDFRNTIDPGDTITLNDWYSWRYASTPEPGLDVYDRITLSGSYTVISVSKQSLRVGPRSGWEYFGAGFEMRGYAWRSVDFGYYFLDLD